MVGNLPAATTETNAAIKLFGLPAECEFGVAEGLNQSDPNKNVGRSQGLLAFAVFTYYLVALGSPLKAPNGEGVLLELSFQIASAIRWPRHKSALEKLRALIPLSFTADPSLL